MICFLLLLKDNTVDIKFSLIVNIAHKKGQCNFKMCHITILKTIKLFCLCCYLSPDLCIHTQHINGLLLNNDLNQYFLGLDVVTLLSIIIMRGNMLCKIKQKPQRLCPHTINACFFLKVYTTIQLNNQAGRPCCTNLNQYLL